ncbi:exodeoxyribonuclease VII small subunit [Prevotella sp. P3-120]|uniref:Exodeoxyribonuclease VII small subunit n=1 Tax=Xylanibacter brevis TaxID=83231 RepID=A0ABS9CC12_9BACT|nr:MULTISPECIES: exodeoxyribonuclease VII small subunit [Prevotellaceae]MBS7319268.1 exodeoxyribonuclease VII small subunit [Prevotella sp.]MCF2562516.1 exodeoxyribonuclease VII small subunit [Xylanibacter brevis]MDD7172038.1 exodeoxyribonuclease VII small subunit [Prevotella sp.]MDY4684521.1 exodeoxyribonuclease VII small subunit [Prevotella sp.]MEE1140237.1 exodeoxyribonuclease VII small subunit [Prevotella sp.]
MNHPQKYEEAFARLQEIVRKMEGGQLDIDQITAHMKEAQELITLCKKRLTETEKEIDKLTQAEK